MRLLIITHTFPPSNHSNAKRPFQVVKGALDAGWDVGVMTSYIGFTPGEEECIRHPRLKIVRIDDFFLRVIRSCQAYPRFGMVVMKLINGILWPDYCGGWIRKIRHVRQQFGDYDRILAFIFPPSVLKLGQEAGLVGRNWIFDYQESVSPQFERYPRGSLMQRLLTPKLKRLERDTLHRAGKVIFTAQSNRLAYIEANLVPARETEHIPYFFDSKAFTGSSIQDKAFEIRYFGGFDLKGERSPKTFLQAFRVFLDRYPEAKNQAKFHFYGNWLPAHDKIIQELGLEEQCELHNPLPYDRYLEALTESPVLLLVIAKAHDLFMPSKIVDYLGARRPILAFLPESSEMTSVLNEAGMACFSCGEFDVEAGALAISHLWTDYAAEQFANLEFTTAKWSSDFQIPRYLKALEDAGSVPDPRVGGAQSAKEPSPSH